MHNDETQKDEPSHTAVNPYDYYPFSGEFPNIPPPPPKKGINWTAIAIIFSSLSLIISLVLLGIVINNSLVKNVTVSPPYPKTGAATPTLTTLSTMPYSAMSIYSDFVKAGLQMTIFHGDATNWQVFGYVPEDGSIQWTEVNGDFMSIAVFANHSEAITDQNQIYRSSDGPAGVTVINRCLLESNIGDPASTITEYINAMAQYCT